MVLEFYYHPMSPPSQSIKMLIKELGMDHEEIVVDLFTGEQKSKEYKAVNPHQKVPAIVDGDLRLAESRAIAIYLCTKYEPSDKPNKLYPKDVSEAAKMNMALFRGIDNLNQLVRYMNAEAIYLGKAAGPLEEALPKVQAVLSELNSTLSNSTYLGGEHLTLLDLFAVNFICVLSLVDFEKWTDYPNVQKWRKKMAELPYFDEVHTKPLETGVEFFRGLRAKSATTLAENKQSVS